MRTAFFTKLQIFVFLIMVGNLPLSGDEIRHDYFVSVAEAEFDPSTGRVKVAMKLFTDDLEAMLKKNFDVAPFLGGTNEDGRVDSLLTNYLSTRFRIKGETEFQWVGKEVNPDATWLYFTIQLDRNTTEITITHSVFFDMFEDQVNILHLRGVGGTSSAYFNKEKPQQILTIRHE
ncbi:MAG: hypothetical protein LPK47_07630 [Bacteroidota bacterium]|nr:hypothetical protein [Bacteroidota bacterium]